jgi:small GTP-binding protein
MNNVIPSTICLIGYFGIGKSSLLSSFMFGTFNKNSESTIGMCYLNKLIKNENYNISLNIWDTAGQERYAALLPMYTRDADVILSVIDPTQEIESVNYINKVLNDVLEARTKNPPFGVHVVISKIDTQENLEKCEKIAKKVKLNIEDFLFRVNNTFTEVSLFYTSSKQNFNTELPFLESLEKIYREKNPIIPENKEKDPLLINVLNYNETLDKYSCNFC